MIELAVAWLLQFLSVPGVGLSAVFVVSFVSATLLPMGSEPAVFATVKANGALFWPVIGIATVGNTLGGAVDYWMGAHARRTFARERGTRWFHWLERYGPKTMLLSWLPVIGDPMCTLAGWLHMPFWPSVAYMAAGKLLRYLTITSLLLYIPNGFWREVGRFLGG
jgi:membrane protein YqaA with SNARE-associated domain